jgi:hypothetical protein
MSIHETIKIPLLAGALALLPLGAMAAGIGGGHAGGGAAMTSTPPNVGSLRPGQHAGGGLPVTTNQSTHANLTTLRPQPVTGTRLPPSTHGSGPITQGGGATPDDPAPVGGATLDPPPSDHPQEHQ